MKKTFVIVTLLLSVFATNAFAEMEWIPIYGEHTVVDELNGVGALYTNLYNSDSDADYSCAAFVKRYYLYVYEVDVYNLFNDGPPLIRNSTNSMVRVDTPQVGDIIFYPTSRNKNNHSAIVKAVDGNTITLIEQNWKTNSQAAINRTIVYPSELFEIWRLDSVPSIDNQHMDEYTPRAMSSTPTVHFSDVPESHWSHEFIYRATALGYVTGYTDNTFRPDAPITRQEFCVIAARAVGTDISAYENTFPTFSDVSPNSFFLPYIEAAKYYLLGELVDGEQVFNPYSPLSREDAFTAIAKILGIEDESTVLDFTDADLVSPEILKYVTATISHGIVSGTSGGLLSPKSTITRAQMAKLFVTTFGY